MFLIAPGYLLISLIRKILLNKNKYGDLILILFIISFIGLLTASMAASINITYCYWVLLGLGYAMCFGKPGDDIKHE